MSCPTENYRAVVRSTDITLHGAAALELRQWMIMNDPHRPLYHFTGPESWINDPNGVIYHDGLYHLFYQYDPIVDGKRSARCWGHAVSNNLVNWRDWPVALWPDSRYDRNGVFSGNMVIDDQGVPTALYTGNVSGHEEAYGMMARSHDGLLSWQKKMVMHNDRRPSAESPVHWDAQVWKDQGRWFQLIGGCHEGVGAAHLWSSPDLETWTHENVVCSAGPAKFWELPYLVRFDDRYVLFVGWGNPYWVGRYDRSTFEFVPDQQEPRWIDSGNYYSFNLHMTDNRGPGNSMRQLMHGWVTGPPSPSKNVPYWEGAHSIPRTVRLHGDRLFQEPVPEIEGLRGNHASGNDALKTLASDSMECIATFRPTQRGRFGVKIRASKEDNAAVYAFYDGTTHTFGFDGDVLPVGVQPSGLGDDDDVSIRLFVDRSIIEMYVNGTAVTARCFLPSTATGGDTFIEDNCAQLRELDVWTMRSMWQVED